MFNPSRRKKEKAPLPHLGGQSTQSLAPPGAHPIALRRVPTASMSSATPLAKENPYLARRVVQRVALDRVMTSATAQKPYHATFRLSPNSRVRDVPNSSPVSRFLVRSSRFKAVSCPSSPGILPVSSKGDGAGKRVAQRDIFESTQNTCRARGLPPVASHHSSWPLYSLSVHISPSHAMGSTTS